MKEVSRDSTSMYFHDARNLCVNSGTGRFLMEFLRPFERDAFLATLNTSHEWWIGIVMKRQAAPTIYKSFYCMNYSLDYDPKQCCDGCAYAQGYVIGAAPGTFFCARPAGFSCLTGAWNENVNTLYTRLTWDGTTSSWIINDNPDNFPSHRFGHVCCNLEVYGIVSNVN